MSFIIIHVGCSVSICDEADALSIVSEISIQKLIAKFGLPCLSPAGKVVVHNYLVNAISLSLSLTTSFCSFHMVGRISKQNTVIFSTIYVLQYALPSQKYGNALKILYNKKILISKMLEVTMLMKDYDRRACRHPSCVEASPRENLCVCC